MDGQAGKLSPFPCWMVSKLGHGHLNQLRTWLQTPAEDPGWCKFVWGQQSEKKSSPVCTSFSLESDAQRHFFILLAFEAFRKMCILCHLYWCYDILMSSPWELVTSVLGNILWYLAPLCVEKVVLGLIGNAAKLLDYWQKKIFVFPQPFWRMMCFYFWCTNTSVLMVCGFLINCVWNEHPSQRVQIQKEVFALLGRKKGRSFKDLFYLSLSCSAFARNKFRWYI